MAFVNGGFPGVGRNLASIIQRLQCGANETVMVFDDTYDNGIRMQALATALTSWPAAVSATEVGYLDGVTSAIQTQLDAKGSPYHAHVTGVGGTGNAITGTISPARTLVAGDRITFVAANANTGATTIALTGATPATAIAIQKGPATALANADIDANAMISAVYNGTVWLCPNYGFA